jgi:hypothetical protein
MAGLRRIFAFQSFSRNGTVSQLSAAQKRTEWRHQTMLN